MSNVDLLNTGIYVMTFKTLSWGLARVIQANMDMSSSNLNTTMAGYDMPTIPTIVTTVLSEKRVSRTSIWLRVYDFSIVPGEIHPPSILVYVSPLVVKELKHIVESSEIIKCVFSTVFF